MKPALSGRFGFLVNEVSRLYSQQFDRLAREKLGLSQAQCRLLAVLAWHEGEEALSQVELAQKTGLTAMGVATMCDRLAAAGWIERRAHPGDRRVNRLHIKPSARKALEQAMHLADDLTAATLGAMSAAERKQLLALLARAREGLLAAAAPGEAA
ncbi:MarR family winged helix-turn-helix transcriptional regulator [Ramlibacter alkalitolerans]|uniref:MarR family transcriptional regulator n=1 Tax=Ramlibacter alkalitolerans TaxID=2039631 RepID=A0ABS1JMB9_9BURK|nr:MarR family transcriptional regulator [Ramlibacter alkalitolerans]MBL0425362.1 MarR family transcriptional regulator [Ramlibacter alkalitolerans]